MTPGEQKLVDEAYAAIVRATRGCPGMTKYAHRAMEACGDLLERYSTLGERDSPTPTPTSCNWCADGHPASPSAPPREVRQLEAVG